MRIGAGFCTTVILIRSHRMLGRTGYEPFSSAVRHLGGSLIPPVKRSAHSRLQPETQMLDLNSTIRFGDCQTHTMHTGGLPSALCHFPYEVVFRLVAFLFFAFQSTQNGDGQQLRQYFSQRVLIRVLNKNANSCQVGNFASAYCRCCCYCLLLCSVLRSEICLNKFCNYYCGNGRIGRSSSGNGIRMKDDEDSDIGDDGDGTLICECVSFWTHILYNTRIYSYIVVV